MMAMTKPKQRLCGRSVHKNVIDGVEPGPQAKATADVQG